MSLLKIIMAENPPIRPIFIAYHHKPFQIGNKLEEESQKNSENIIYLHPTKADSAITEQLLSVFISLDTYSNISLNGKHLDFLSLQDQKIAIKYYERTDKTFTVFILSLSSIYEDAVVKQKADDLLKGLFFILGPDGISNNLTLKNFLLTECDRIMNLISPKNESIINHTFPAFDIAEKHPSLLPTGLVELYMMNTDPRIWGMTCFVDNQLLISMSPPPIIRLYQFCSPLSPQDKVYLTRENREQILNEQNIKAEIPDSDIIIATLIRFDKGPVTFFVLVSDISEDLLLRVADTINNKTIPHIISIPPKPANHPSKLMMYDREMEVLHAGDLPASGMSSTAFLHTIFTDKMPATDALAANYDELIVGFNVHGVENYSYVPCIAKPMFEDAYTDAIHQSPQLTRLLANIKQ